MDQMMNHESAGRPIEELYFEARSLISGKSVGLDHCRIFRAGTGFLIESTHTCYSNVFPHRHSSFRVAHDWTPLSLDVRAEGAPQLKVVFDEQLTTWMVEDWSEPQQLAVTGQLQVSRRRSLFLLNDAFSFPLHVVKRVSPCQIDASVFDLLPAGTCEVRQNGRRDGLRTLRMLIQTPTQRDEVDLLVDENGHLSGYRSRANGILVTRQPRPLAS